MYSSVACVKLHLVGFCTECVRDKFSGGSPRSVFSAPWVCVLIDCGVFIIRFLPTPMPLLFKWHKLMSTDWIWEQWDNDSVTNFPVTFLLLCVSTGDFSRRRTSMWRRAAPPAWWPMRIYRSSPYQVKQLSTLRCFMWKNWASLLQLWEETGSIVILLSQNKIFTITGETSWPYSKFDVLWLRTDKTSSACVLLLACLHLHFLLISLKRLQEQLCRSRLTAFPSPLMPKHQTSGI